MSDHKHAGHHVVMSFLCRANTRVEHVTLMEGSNRIENRTSRDIADVFTDMESGGWYCVDCQEVA